MSEEEKISYYAIIPAPVRYDSELTANAKLMYGEITALCNKNGFCWASNKYFSQLYKCTPQAISKWIKQLEEKQYITTKYTYKGDSKEIDQRIIYLTDKVSTNIDRVSTNVDKVSTKSDEGYQQKVKENNTSINNTFNNKKESKKVSKETFDELINNFTTDKEIQELIKEWLKIRKLKRLPLTNHSLELNLRKVEGLAKASNLTIKEYLEEVIARGWGAFYEIKNAKPQRVTYAPSTPVECTDPEFLKEKEELQRTLNQAYAPKENSLERFSRQLDEYARNYEEKERLEKEQNDK